jgi:amino acid transporter
MGGVIGSGWLFAGMYAAKASGPAATISWIVGGAAILVVAWSGAFQRLSFPQPVQAILR